MNWNELLFLAIVFIVVAGVALAGIAIFSPIPLRERLREFRGTPEEEPVKRGEGEWVERVARVARPLTKLSLPEDGWERSPLRTRFINAGWRSSSAPTLYFAAKTM